MRKIFKYYIPVLFVLTIRITFPAFSQQPADSLMTYLEIAAKNNPAVMQKFTEYKASLQKIPQAGSLPDPELTADAFLKPMELMMGYQVADIKLMQTFPWFGVLRNARDEMSLIAKTKFELFRDAKLSLFYDVQSTWYEMNKYQQDILISEKNVEILKTIERLTIVRFKSPSSSGGPGLADIYRIQIEIGDLENNIASLNSMMVTLSSRFNKYLNRPVKTPVSVADTLMPEIFDISLTAVSDSMLANNPMLGMLKLEQQSLDARYRMVKAMGYPMVGVGVNYSIISKLPYFGVPRNGNDAIMPMVSVTLPIYRKKYKAMKSEVELQKTATSFSYQATSNSLQAEFYEAVQAYQDAMRRQKLYSDQSLLADKSLSIMLKSFASSGSGLTDILRVRQQTLDYKFKRVEAVVDYNTAVAWLRRLMAYYKIQQI